MGRRTSLALREVLLFLVLHSAFGSPEESLLAWAASGAQVYLRAVPPCAVCAACGRSQRAVVAARSFEAGDVIVRLPANLSIALGSGALAEQAYRLVERLRLDAKFNATFAPYLAALPGPGEVLSPELFTKDDLAVLQTPELERLVRQKLALVEEVYTRRGPGPAQLSMADIKYMAALIRTRNFWLLGQQRLVPIFDLLDHREDPNTEYTGKYDGEQWLLLKATRNIKEGEVLTDRYMASTLHRGDASLFHYGFLQEEYSHLLCSVDLPTYSRLSPWAPTEMSDDGYLKTLSAGSWMGRIALRREYGRLASLLAAMPTTEGEDEVLLAGGSLGGWREELLVRFRLQRKRALRRALERLEDARVV